MLSRAHFRQKFALSCVAASAVSLAITGCGGGSSPVGKLAGRYRVETAPNTVGTPRFSPDGKVILSTSTSSGEAAAFGSNLFVSPQNLQNPPGQSSVRATAVNTGGNLVGFDNSSSPSLVHQGVYWESPTATPTLLKAPTTNPDTQPTAINAEKQILAASRETLYFYASPTAAPVKLAENATGLLNDSGIMVYGSSTLPYVVKDSIQGSANPLTDPEGKPVHQVSAIGADGAILGQSSNNKACYWEPDNYSQSHYFNTPAGTTVSFAASINASGQTVGHCVDTMGRSHACLWSTLSANPIDLTTQADASQVTFAIAGPIFNDGSLIAFPSILGGNVQAYHLVPKTKSISLASFAKLGKLQ